jgi:hypothetical protein
LAISHEISAERGYFKVPHLGHWFVLVRFVNFSRSTLRLFQITFFNSILLFFILSPSSQQLHFSPFSSLKYFLVFHFEISCFLSLLKIYRIFFYLQISPLVLRICRLVLLSKFCPGHHSITRVSSLLGLRHRCQPIKGLNHCRTTHFTPTHQKSPETPFTFLSPRLKIKIQKTQEQLEDSTNLQTLTVSNLQIPEQNPHQITTTSHQFRNTSLNPIITQQKSFRIGFFLFCSKFSEVLRKNLHHRTGPCNSSMNPSLE